MSEISFLAISLDTPRRLKRQNRHCLQCRYMKQGTLSEQREDGSYFSSVKCWYYTFFSKLRSVCTVICFLWLQSSILLQHHISLYATVAHVVMIDDKSQTAHRFDIFFNSIYYLMIERSGALAHQYCDSELGFLMNESKFGLVFLDDSSIFYCHKFHSTGLFVHISYFQTIDSLAPCLYDRSDQPASSELS